ncbi:hypothetical protein CVT24_012754 [Panaeolus cyanescens]|uniref:F-box domain-containing protein n=1 Tax=Panaeolus cyanescens TaxID=181874 RepID=A0A409YJR3_9AGAR|nr:hypothetical protein CVT24_012754 [Panaeolus cyanescens]
MAEHPKIHTDRAFPLEIFDLIIKQFASKCAYPYQEMQSCALVCKDFAFLARPYLYKKVEFGPYGLYNRNRLRLAEAFSSAPHLGSSVREVCYTMDDMDDETSLLGNVAQASSSLHEFLTDVKDVRITHSEVEGHDAVCAGEECTRLCHVLLKGLASSSPFSNVTDLAVQFIGMNIKVILSMPSLQNLTSEYCHWWIQSPWDDPGYDDEELKDLTYPRHLLLQHLILEQDRGFPLNSLFHFPELESIEFNIDYERPTRSFSRWLRKNPDIQCFQNPVVSFESLTTIEITNAKALLVLCRNARKKNAHAFTALRTFKFRSEQTAEDDSPEALYSVITHMPVLRTFELTINYTNEWLGDDLEVQPGLCLNGCTATLETFRIRFYRPHEMGDISFDAFRLRNLVDGLVSVSGSNQIKDLEIELADTSEKTLDDWKMLTLPIWRQLDELIAGSSTFPSLKKLTLFSQKLVKFSFYESEETFGMTEEEKNWQVDFWPEAFPSLHTAGYRVEHTAKYSRNEYSFIRLPKETAVGTVLEHE